MLIYVMVGAAHSSRTHYNEPSPLSSDKLIINGGDVKTQKGCEQGWQVDVGPKIKQITSILPYISTYTAIKQKQRAVLM